MDLHAHVADFLKRHGLEHSTGIVAISGGPDSVALTHLLSKTFASSQMVLAHVNHQLRGEESDADEMFVQNLAKSLGLACKTTRIDVADIAERERDNLENIARRERYAWLTQVAKEQNANWVATGHTADDQAETVLLRLIRGSGVTALSGIAETRSLGENMALIRPLLAVRRQDLLDYLHAGKIAFRIDSSNQDPRFTRNRLRRDLVPLLHQYNPAIVDVLCRLADQAQEWRTEIAAQSGKLLHDAELPRAGAILVFSVDRLQSASAYLVREMFRALWHRQGWPVADMDRLHWQRLSQIALSGAPACDFPGGIHVRRVGKILQIHGPNPGV